MRLAAEVYEAAVMPRERPSPEPDADSTTSRWHSGLFNGGRRRNLGESGDPVIADIVVIDLRNGAERVEISVTGAEVSPTLARVHEDLDTLSVETFDETWGLI